MPNPDGTCDTSWFGICGKPCVTVSPVGFAQGLGYNAGADYGPDTPGTRTNGLQEAYDALPPLYNEITGTYERQGTIYCLTGKFTLTDTVIIDVNATVAFVGLGAQMNFRGTSANQVGGVIWDCVGDYGAINQNTYVGGTTPAGTVIIRGITFYYHGSNLSAYDSNTRAAILQFQAASISVIEDVAVIEDTQGQGTYSYFSPVTVGNALDNLAYINRTRISVAGKFPLVMLFSTSNHLYVPNIAFEGVAGSSTSNYAIQLGTNGLRCHFGSVQMIGAIYGWLEAHTKTNSQGYPSNILEIEELSSEVTSPSSYSGNAWNLPTNVYAIIGKYIWTVWDVFTGAVSTGSPNPVSSIGLDQIIIQNAMPVWAPTAPTVGSSPYSYTNSNPYRVTAVLDPNGATISAVTLTRGSTTANLPAAGQSVNLNPGDVLKVTYTTATPILTIYPE